MTKPLRYIIDKTLIPKGTPLANTDVIIDAGGFFRDPVWRKIQEGVKQKFWDLIKIGLPPLSRRYKAEFEKYGLRATKGEVQELQEIIQAARKIYQEFYLWDKQLYLKESQKVLKTLFDLGKKLIRVRDPYKQKARDKFLILALNEALDSRGRLNPSAACACLISAIFALDKNRLGAIACITAELAMRLEAALFKHQRIISDFKTLISHLNEILKDPAYREKKEMPSGWFLAERKKIAFLLAVIDNFDVQPYIVCHKFFEIKLKEASDYLRGGLQLKAGKSLREIKNYLKNLEKLNDVLGKLVDLFMRLEDTKEIENKKPLYLKLIEIDLELLKITDRPFDKIASDTEEAVWQATNYLKKGNIKKAKARIKKAQERLKW